jgi:hypothetical protein
MFALSRTWVEHDLFPMLSPPVHTYLQEKKKEGLPPDFLWRLVALVNGSCGFPCAKAEEKNSNYPPTVQREHR